MSSSRTSSPYFSPKSAIAPSAFACAIGRMREPTGAFSRIFSLTFSSTSRSSCSVTACV